MALIRSDTNDLGSLKFEVNGQEVQVSDMTVNYGTSPYDPYANQTTNNWVTGVTDGTATITTNWPPADLEIKKRVSLDCLVCDNPTEYIGLIEDEVNPDVLALCPTCLEAVKEMRNHFIVGEIAEIMED